ncbi:hypothetical protein [Acinetobacter bereziniae]|uniref:hypothetical protein n=1 Tax=Acinetobacter bereziniae TaxID=106648 RepID=UPI0019023C5E|nr:hypothetical protein [Acinetobacter bereziniae]MBJ9903167.1 hypothetical protein [Acinetobacter bereziniae]
MISELDQIILQRNSIKDATHIDESNGLKFLLLQHTRHIWCGVAWGITSHDFTGLTPIIKTETSIQTIKINGLEDLIDGKAALIALANGEEVEFKHDAHGWVTCLGLNIEQVIHGMYQLRLKPRIISINGKGAA